MQAIRLSLNVRAAERVRRGYPWIFRSDVTNANEVGAFTAGTVACFGAPDGDVVATGYAHPKAQLMGRVLVRDDVAITKDVFVEKFRAALQWRQDCFDKPYYRLVYGESDFVPGLIVDRFGDTLVAQVNTAGMDALQPLWLPALQEVVQAKNIVLKNDSTGRALEDLPKGFNVVQGRIPDNNLIELIENGTRFYADLREGQKTGWFYDQRPHRQWVADRAQGKTVIDVFCHTGAFGVTAGKAGAAHVTFVDVSDSALALGKQNAALNGLSNCDFIAGKAFDVLAALPQQYDIVCVDPPAFVKVKKDMAVGLKGYEKLARLAAPLVKSGGVLFYASCSSHPTEQDILNVVLTGAGKAGRMAALVYNGMAGPDHPMHPLLPETRYLKALGFRVT